jgi:hypothetical protein
MQSPSNDHSQSSPSETQDLIPEEQIIVEEPVCFQTDFEGFMDMYCDLPTVAEYLQTHENWFSRCAEPMKAEPFGKNGYTLTVGRFGSHGYEVEPKMTVILETPDSGRYIMRSIPTEEYMPPGYKVDYQSSLFLEEIAMETASKEIEHLFKKKGVDNLPLGITKVNWQLHLSVLVKFPRFIYKLPLSLIENAGDALLSQIIRQISPRLSYKVQEDFHRSFNLPLPPKTSRRCWRAALETEVLSQNESVI